MLTCVFANVLEKRRILQYKEKVSVVMCTTVSSLGTIYRSLYNIKSSFLLHRQSGGETKKDMVKNDNVSSKCLLRSYHVFIVKEQ